MAITRFEDLPSENSPINSENLNGNFDELGVKVGTSVDNNYRTNIIKGLNGNASIVVDNEEIYNKNMMDTLESLKPYILYESSSGVSTGSITLNDSKNNYKYMEVFCNRSGLRTSHKFIVSSSNTATYALPMIGTSSDQLIIRTIGFTISGTTLTITINNRTNIATGSTTFTPDANQLNVVMVIGYK